LFFYIDNLTKPLCYSPASEEKFRSSYKLADTVNFQDAVINLVSLVQIALYLFKLLDKDYIDGLICDETNKALWTFYTKYDPIKTTEVSSFGIMCALAHIFIELMTIFFSSLP
jgi:hypothetical protein